MYTPARNDIGRNDRSRLDIPYGMPGACFFATLSSSPAKSRNRHNITASIEAKLASASSETLFEKAPYIESEFYDYGARLDRALLDRARLDRAHAGIMGARIYATLSTPTSKTIHRVASPNNCIKASLGSRAESIHYALFSREQSLFFDTGARLDRALLDFSRLDRARDLPVGASFYASLSSISQTIHKIRISGEIYAQSAGHANQILYQHAELRDSNQFDSTARLDRALLDFSRFDRFRRIPIIKLELFATLAGHAATVMRVKASATIEATLSGFALGNNISYAGLEIYASLATHANAGTQKMAGAEIYASSASHTSQAKHVVNLAGNLVAALSVSAKTRHFIGLRHDFNAILAGNFVSLHKKKNRAQFYATLNAVEIAAYSHRTVEFDVVLNPDDILIIDSTRFTALLNGTNVLDKMSGDFLFLLPGQNTVRYIDRSTGRVAQVQIAYEERYA